MARVADPAEAQSTERVGAAVLEIAAAEGLEAVSAEAVAASLGLGPAVLAAHFAAEDELWRAAGVVLERRITAGWAAMPVRDGPAEERLAALLRGQLHEAAATPVIGELLLGKLLASANPVIVAVLEDIRSRFTALLAQALRDGMAAGVIDPAGDGDEMALQVRVLLQGWVASWRLGLLGPDLERGVEADLEALLGSLAVPAGSAGEGPQ